MRFEAIRRMLEQLQAQKTEVLDSDESLTESEIALGRLVLPLFKDRDELTQKLDAVSRRADALQVAVNHLPVAALVLDPAGALLISNRAARDLFGGPAVPMNVLEECKRLVLRGVHRERSAEFQASPARETPSGRPDASAARVRLRLIPGQVREPGEVRVPQLVFVVKQGTTLPLDAGRVIERYGFTHKEADVALLVAQGLTNKEMAERLSVSHETIRSHLAEAFAKSGAKNRAELVTLLVAAVFGLSPEEP